MPFGNNFFCISVGLIIVFFLSLVVYAFDFEKELWYQPFKTIVILGFLGLAVGHFFIELGGDIKKIDATTVPVYS
jgi:cell division protein FtsW (lipid II flippase)